MSYLDTRGSRKRGSLNKFFHKTVFFKLIVLFGKTNVDLSQSIQTINDQTNKKNFETKCLKEEDRGCLKPKVRILWKRKAL
jgi:hypothetical protein